MRPKETSKHLQIDCKFQHKKSGSGRARQTIVPANVRVHGTHPGDRSVGHSFPFFVECEVPEELAASAQEIRQIALDVVFIGGRVELETIGSTRKNVTIVAQKRDLTVEITPPMPEKSELAVCLSPIYLTEDKLPLRRLLEWRQHLANMGVERVNWYARDERLKAFVDGYKEVKGSKDLFL